MGETNLAVNPVSDNYDEDLLIGYDRSELTPDP